MHSYVWRTLAAYLALTAIAQAAQPSPVATRSPVPAAARPLTSMAPADTYFGPFGMSPLSIRSTIGLLGRQYHSRTISDHDLLRKALLTEDALRKWRTKYPADPWLAPTFFHLEQLYQAVQTDEARKHATAILHDVVQNYPNSKEGHLSRLRLAAGFPALVPESPLVPSPPPTPAPSPGESTTSTPAAQAPDATNSAAPQPTAGASAAPTPSPAAAPSPTSTATGAANSKGKPAP